MKKYPIILLLSLVQLTSYGYGGKQNLFHLSKGKSDSTNTMKGINIYIISKDKYFDFTNRIISWQAKLTALLHSNKLKVITALSTADAETKIAALLKTHQYTINNLWFDSHGKYRKGYSSFMIGTDEYNYKTIADTACCSQLKRIAALCNERTNAADYDFPVLKNGRFENMHGDSLLKGMATIFKGSHIYGSASWVMAKPWIFGTKNALAGFPLNRPFKDSVFKPVWEHMGIWHRYKINDPEVETISTVRLSQKGDILIQNKTYLAQKKARRKLERNLSKLKPDLYDLTLH